MFRSLVFPSFCNANRTNCREELFSDNIIAGLFGKVIRAGRTLPLGGIAGGITDGGIAIAFDAVAFDAVAFEMPAPTFVTVVVVVGGE